ncbi:hypothetical protein ACFVTX_17090 [Agromyces sp. NPDC058136]|uniref:hypothetical protein n=1 Tax=Agromyces sp. NPDC058136 TaxID=3346354 RepID=UPI0036DD8142
MTIELNRSASADPRSATVRAVLERVFRSFAPLPMRIEIERDERRPREEASTVEAPARLGPTVERLP